ncbi:MULTISPECIES: class I SAM-dependent methyltransferase [unclassified Adlercreutzia]|uniref:class I SAM-dependent methyltransferase n=1 Tax=unclassified Adlercreutzia TaxID=2636013 RepID=UPI0013EBB390|nr:MULTISPECIES: class I SAM-dependent methyltransferase [unclassified Adlercreutzia]
MDPITAQRLSDLTRDFYQRVSASFSETRSRAWEGWERMLEECEITGDAGEREQASRCEGAGEGMRAGGQADLFAAAHAAMTAPEPTLRVLDLGCGNLRFERFLAARAGRPVEAFAVDNCAPLVAQGARDEFPEDVRIRFQLLDVTGALHAGADLVRALDAPACDLAVAFGLMHHVPTFDQRVRVLEALADHVRPGGHVAVALWQFARSDKLRAKAEAATARGCAACGIDPEKLEEGDYLMGWQDEQDVFRYCHHFDEAEADALARAMGPRAREVARFSADGKDAPLNRYLVFKVR